MSADNPIACSIALGVALLLFLGFRRIMDSCLKWQQARNQSEIAILYTRATLSIWLGIVILALGVSGFLGLFHIPTPTWLK